MKMTSLKINGRTVSRLSINGREVALGPQCDALCFTAEEPGSTVQLITYNEAPEVNLQISTNGITWTPYTIYDIITLPNKGSKVYFKAIGSNQTIANSGGTGQNMFEMTGKIAASGNVNSLLEEDEEQARTMSLAGRDWCYAYLFQYCTSLTKAPELPSYDIAKECYNGMFEGCSSLKEAPELPAMNLAENCYYYMFYGCTSLTKAPDLPATYLSPQCYAYMFEGCTSLNYISVGFTNWEQQTTDNWLPENTGRFVCPQTLIDNTTERTTSTVPSSWTMVAV